MRGVGHVARMVRREVCTEFLWGNMRERENLEDPGIDGRIILRQIIRKCDVGAWAVSFWLRIGIGGGHF